LPPAGHFVWLAGSIFNGMTIQKNLSGNECELLVTGRIDGKGANDLEIEVLALARSPVKSVALNLAGADFLCSAGIRVILQHHRQWRTQGRSFVVSRTSAEIDQILEMTGLRSIVVEAP
jgi:anti-anti-sigma factor